MNSSAGRSDGQSVVRWGLIGAGDIVQKRVGAALAEAQNSVITAASRRQVERLGEFSARFGIERTYERWEDLIRDDAIDAVYVATPVHLHAPMTVAAAEAGKHVLCEKPMALTVDECDRMIAAAEAANVKLGIAYYRRFYPILTRLKELVSSGPIGSAAVVQVNAFERFNPGPDHPRAWFLERSRSGGGPMFDFGCHRIEILVHLFGPGPRVHSEVTKVAFEREVEDTAVAVFRFDRGPVAVLTVTHAAIEPQDTLDVFGTEGSIHIPVLNEGLLRLVIDGETTEESHPPHGNLHLPLVEQFVEAVLRDDRPAVDGHAGREVNCLLAEIYGSADGS